MGGPELREDLSILIGEDATFGPYGWGSYDVVSAFGQYQLQTYTNLTGYSAEWIVRTQDNNTSTIVLDLTSGSGAITWSALAAEEGPAAPSFNNAFAWSVPNATTGGLVTYLAQALYHTMWLTSGSGVRVCYLKGWLVCKGAQ